MDFTNSNFVISPLRSGRNSFISSSTFLLLFVPSRFLVTLQRKSKLSISSSLSKSFSKSFCEARAHSSLVAALPKTDENGYSPLMNSIALRKWRTSLVETCKERILMLGYCEDTLARNLALLTSILTFLLLLCSSGSSHSSRYS